MAIKHLRTAFASQYQPGQPARLRSGEPLQEPGGDYEALHKQMKRLFNSKPGKKYGRFSDALADSPFSAWLKDYLEDKQTFAALTDRLFGQWQELLSGCQEEFDGHLMVVHEALADQEVVYLILLETDGAMRFDGDQRLDSTDVLSLSRLNLALRVELDDWLGDQGGDNYLTLVHGRGTGEPGELFIRLCGFNNSVDVEKETLTFLDAVEAFAKSSAPEKAGEVRTRAYEFCKEQHALGEPVEIEALSSYLDEEQPQRFKEFASQNAELPDTGVLHPDHRKVKKLVRIAGSGGGLSLSFSSDLVNQAVYYDRDKDALTITRLPKALREQLQRYLESRET
ncbi:nucleoid-associated protein [Marinobacter lutaoensis]|uniref:Nucleoid-associated protein NdpA n=1 Tax=Marinobacter lutaoensis TaxID=135739 RepID=A0A1V2DXF9_9GAMM|nr:nucleoid-associated protein [Marinobacter lutaoensis]MBI43281.1 nucleoid-associated protein NdpA [Oceanospirillales bacterium]NVD34938.1 nucleoid-associated protein [Marinobacter lutaoensis]ONF44971.1 nucleoid-associated protein NdpA [Marinobacter lutaoensis]